MKNLKKIIVHFYKEVKSRKCSAKIMAPTSKPIVMHVVSHIVQALDPLN